MIPKWETLSKHRIQELKIFRADLVQRYHPIWKKTSEFVVLDSNDWANIIPITNDNKILLIEQFRHGSNSITIEIPGGLIETDELPIDAARRECLEETGYSSDEDLQLLGVSQPNPAFLNNKCYTYLWTGLERVSEQNLDNNEEINIIPTDIHVVKQMIQKGEINHSIITTAFLFYFLKFGF